MTTQLDEKIDQLENMVEKWLDRHYVTRSGDPATLPAKVEQTKPLEFPIEFLQRLACRK